MDSQGYSILQCFHLTAFCRNKFQPMFVVLYKTSHTFACTICLTFRAKCILSRKWLALAKHLASDKDPHKSFPLQFWHSGYCQKHKPQKCSAEGAFNLPTSQSTACLWIELIRDKCKPTLVCCAYRAPDSDFQTFISSLHESMSSVDLEKSDVVILGDLNADMMVSSKLPKEINKYFLIFRGPATSFS